MYTKIQEEGTRICTDFLAAALFQPRVLESEYRERGFERPAGFVQLKMYITLDVTNLSLQYDTISMTPGTRNSPGYMWIRSSCAPLRSPLYNVYMVLNHIWSI